jgi:hypothetical protein
MSYASDNQNRRTQCHIPRRSAVFSQARPLVDSDSNDGNEGSNLCEGPHAPIKPDEFML